METTSQRGLYHKYDVFKRGTHEAIPNCFILRIDKDKFAQRALAHYADACESKYPELAHDLRNWLTELIETH